MSVEPSAASRRRRSAAPTPQRSALGVGRTSAPASRTRPPTPVYAALLGVFVLGWLIVTIDGGDVPHRRQHRQHAAALGRARHRRGRPDARHPRRLARPVGRVRDQPHSLVAAETMDGQRRDMVPGDPRRARRRRRRRPRQRAADHQAAGQRVHRHARHRPDHQGLHRQRVRRPGRAACPTRSSTSATTRFGPSRVGVPAARRSSRSSGSCCAAPASATTSSPSAATRRWPGLSGRAHDRTIIVAHVLCSLCAAHRRALPRQPARRRRAAGRPRGRLRPGVDRRRRARRHRAGRRPRRRARHGRRRAASSRCSTTCSTSSRSTPSSSRSSAASSSSPRSPSTPAGPGRRSRRMSTAATPTASRPPGAAAAASACARR